MKKIHLIVALVLVLGAVACRPEPAVVEKAAVEQVVVQEVVLPTQVVEKEVTKVVKETVEIPVEKEITKVATETVKIVETVEIEKVVEIIVTPEPTPSRWELFEEQMAQTRGITSAFGIDQEVLFVATWPIPEDPEDFPLLVGHWKGPIPEYSPGGQLPHSCVTNALNGTFYSKGIGALRIFDLTNEATAELLARFPDIVGRPYQWLEISNDCWNAQPEEPPEVSNPAREEYEQGENQK